MPYAAGKLQRWPVPLLRMDRIAFHQSCRACDDSLCRQALSAMEGVAQSGRQHTTRRFSGTSGTEIGLTSSGSFERPQAFALPPSPPCGADLRVPVARVGLPIACTSAETAYRLQTELPAVWLFVVNYKYPKTTEESSTAAINRPHCARQLRRMDGSPPSCTDIECSALRSYRVPAARDQAGRRSMSP